ncbi:MAG: Asp-tRNA(Asn)/Glu-tRNA(Gln) amidotransferase subunit GatB, partial [Patescibacteria group bacterium]
MATYLPTIGMEIHFHLKTKSKMFCSCANEYLAAPNKNICPVCTAQPGALPVPNAQAIEWVGLIGLALGCKLASQFNFERKNYFYPDLPKGYQITSANQPPCLGGSIMVGSKKIRVNHVHLEEDTGSLKHSADGKSSLVDLNRAGAPLVELVSEADMVNGWEAKTFCQELQLILRTLGVADADMEKGQMRCEVNISVRPKGQSEWGTKVEIKNLNSFRTVEKAIDYEIERQSARLESGETVSQATRGWDEKKQQTVSQRTKESAHDYRYFPEPDIPPLTFDQDHFEQLQAQLPELPIAKRQRFEAEYGFTAEDARL